MYRSRFASVMFVLACFSAGGLVLRHLQGPWLRPAAAQASGGASEPGASLRPAKPDVRRAALAAIQAQLAAFGRGDYATAIKYQSTGLKQNFASPDAFRQMMQSAYPEFAHSKKVKFGLVKSDAAGQHVLVPVELTGQDGVTVQAAYLLVREGKAYRVEGVLGGGRQPLPSAPGDTASV